MPACPRCDDMGFEVRVVAGVERAVTCACRLEGAAARRIADARIPARYSPCSFATFDALEPCLLFAKGKAKEFADGYPFESRKGILFLGRSGGGKTHLAVAILRYLVEEKGTHGLFYDYSDFLRDIQSSWDRESATTSKEILDSVKDVEVLLLDDLGSMRPLLWVQEILFHILNSRYNDEKTTLITSNLIDHVPEPGFSAGRKKDLQDTSLENQIGVRLRSRLYEMCQTVSIDPVNDYRQNVKQVDYRPGH